LLRKRRRRSTRSHQSNGSPVFPFDYVRPQVQFPSLFLAEKAPKLSNVINSINKASVQIGSKVDNSSFTLSFLDLDITKLDAIIQSYTPGPGQTLSNVTSLTLRVVNLYIPGKAAVNISSRRPGMQQR